MEEYNLKSEIIKLMEEKVFKSLNENRIAIRHGWNSGEYEFLIRGEWTKIENWENDKAKNKPEIERAFRENRTIYFVKDLFDFCKWYVETEGKKFDNNKYKVIIEE